MFLDDDTVAELECISSHNELFCSDVKAYKAEMGSLAYLVLEAEAPPRSQLRSRILLNLSSASKNDVIQPHSVGL